MAHARDPEAKADMNPSPDSVDNISIGGVARRVGLGTIGGVFGQVINILARIVIIPLFAWAWGDILYGEWLTLYAVVGYLSMLDFGMSMYIINRLNQLHSVHNLKEYNKIFQSALSMFILISIGALLLFVLGAFSLPISKWFNFSLMRRDMVAFVTVLLATQLIFKVPQGLIVGVYRTLGEYPRQAVITALQLGAVWGLTAVILVFHGGPIHVAMVQLVPFLGTTALVLYDLHRRHPEVQIGIRERDWRLALTFLAPSFLFLLIQLSMALTLQGSTLVIASFTGPSAVAMFVVIRTIPNLIRQIIGTLNNALWPELTRLEARGQYAPLRSAHRGFVKLSFAVTVSAAIVLHFVGADVIQRWTLGRIGFNQVLLDVFLLYFIFQTPWRASSLFPAAFNKHRMLAFHYVVNSVLGLGLAVALVRPLGVVGVVLGFWIADVLVCGWFVPYETCRMLGEQVGRFWFHSIIRGLPVVALQYSGAWAINFLLGNWLMRTLAIGAWVSFVLLVGGYFLWLTPEEKGLLRGLSLKLYAKTRNLLRREVHSEEQA